MTGYTLKERIIPMHDAWDIIVAGGGPAGCTAAAAAAREGMKVLLLESTGALGGMGTSGLVPAWCPFSNGKEIIYRGLAEKVFSLCKAGMPHVAKDALYWVPIDPELLKRIYDDLVTEAGAEVLFNSSVCAVEMEGDSLSTVIVSNKAGLTAYKASVFVDCTGDADLAAWAGAEFHKGDPETHELAPVTHCFVLTNVDEYGYRTGPDFHAGNRKSPVHAIQASGKYPHILDVHSCNTLIGPGTVGFNSGHIWNVDNTDPASVSKGLIEGRKVAHDFQKALAEYIPATYANAFLVATGSLIGARETRRIVGDYELVADDYIARRSFADEIGRNSYYMDIHYSVAETKAAREGKLDDAARCKRMDSGESHGIPYRCLTPKGIRNVLVAGRAVSCDRSVQGSVRVMPVCLVMGEAAGVAAAQAVRDTLGDVHAIDTQVLRTSLKGYGAYLPAVE